MNNTRVLMVVILMFLSMLGLSYSLYNIQVRDHGKYKNIAKRQQEDSLVIHAERGLIKDRNGETLTFTRDDQSFIAYMPLLKKNSKNTKKIAQTFSKVFNKSSNYYLKLLQSDKRFVYLEKKVSNDKALLLKDFVVDGLIKRADYTRIYPYGSLASHVLGYVNKQNVGIDGIEREYNQFLTGKNGLFYVERDVLGNIISINDELSRKSTPGNTVVLTIDKNYQNILEDALREGISKYKAASASGVIINPNTGEILALANVPDFNPSFYSQATGDERRNRAVIDPYEPGSTFKSISLAILMEENLVNLSERIDVENGSYRLYKVRISDTHRYDVLNVAEILSYSSNVGMAKLSTRISSKIFYKYLRDFGFGNYSLVELPAENPGLLKKPDQYSKISLPFISFGYEVLVTPLQLIYAYGALINGGYLYKPQIIKRVISPENEILDSMNPIRIRQVISKETSDKIRKVMVEVVENGTGEEAQIENILVGGKTGTSQKFTDSGYSKKEYNSSFIGFFPAENPQILCLILVNSPGVGMFGGLVAAPIFKEVGTNILRQDPDLYGSGKILSNKEPIASNLFEDIDTQYAVNNENVNYNLPEVAYSDDRSGETYDSGTMPDLIDRTKRDALAIMNEIGIDFKITGNGRVVYQSIKPGSVLSTGQSCLIKCDQQNNESL